MLLERSYDILSRVDNITADFAGFREGLVGTLNIGSVSSSGSVLIDNNFIAFREHFPNIKYNFYEGNSFQIIKMLEKGSIEIGIVRTPFDMSRFNSILCEPSPMVAAAQKSIFPFGNAKTISVEALENQPLIINRRFHSLLKYVSHENHLNFNFVCLNNDARTTLYWAQRGIGIGLASKTKLRYQNRFEKPNISLYTNV